MAYILTKLTPAIIKLIDWFDYLIKFSKENKHLITGVFAAVATVVTATYIPAMIRAAAVTLAATWPWLIIIGILGILYDELMNAAEGNETMYSVLAEKYPLIEKIFDTFFDGIFGLIDWIQEAGSETGLFVADVVEYFGEMKDNIATKVTEIINRVKQFFKDLKSTVIELKDGFVKGVTDQFEAVRKKVEEIWNGILDFIKGIWKQIIGIVDGVLNVGSTITNGIGNFGSSVKESSYMPWNWRGGKEAKKGIKKGQQQLGAASSHPISQSRYSTTSQSRSTTVKIDKLSIETQATDANGIASAAEEALNKALASLGAETSPGRATG